MCILSIYKENDKVIFTHNRDENIKRLSSDVLISKKINNDIATYPVDLVSGGTWILTSKLWSTAILNGATKPHKRKSNYKHSRGVLPYKLMEFDDILNYYDSLNLQGVEPFTQIILNNNTKRIYNIYWDENHKHFTEITDSIFVISSSTLYSEKQKKYNIEKIKSIMEFNSDNLSQCHASLFYDKINRDSIIKTTAMVQIYIDDSFKSMKYTKFRYNT